MRRLLLVCAVTAAVGCASEPSAVVVHEHTLSAGPESPGSSGSAGPTTTVAPTTTTVPEPVPSTIVVPVDPELNPPEPVATTAPRRTTTTVPRPAIATPTVHGADFWYRLATCESRNGELSANQFQFMGGTAEKVGYYPGASYEAQRAMAIDWASRIHPNEGTNAGWPVCWWVALWGGS